MYLQDADCLIVVVKDGPKTGKEAPQQVAKISVDWLAAARIQCVALCHEVGYHQIDQAVAGEAACMYLMQASFLR